jgi:hypothetical protein
VALRIEYKTKDGEFEETIVGNFETIEEAATAAMRTAADIIKAAGRASIAAQGFSVRWQNTLRVQAWPKSGASAKAAVSIRHLIDYAGVFEQPMTIRGDPWLWLPLRSTPRKAYGEKLDPENLELFGIKLFRMKGTDPPLLGARVRMDSRRAATGKISLSLLRRGATETTATGRRRRGAVRTIPLFVGKRSVTTTKRFGIAQIVENTAGLLPSLYASHLKVE